MYMWTEMVLLTAALIVKLLNNLVINQLRNLEKVNVFFFVLLFFFCNKTTYKYFKNEELISLMRKNIGH